MSFEGYYQFLCEKGHSHSADVYEYYEGIEEADWKCWCNAGLGWWNIVDVTNGSFEGDERIDGYVELEEKVPAVICKCKTCGNKHAVTQPTFKIPRGNGHVVVRETDIRIDTYNPAVPNAETTMTLLHIPTGVTVKGRGKSQYRLRKELMEKVEREINGEN